MNSKPPNNQNMAFTPIRKLFAGEETLATIFGKWAVPTYLWLIFFFYYFYADITGGYESTIKISRLLGSSYALCFIFLLGSIYSILLALIIFQNKALSKALRSGTTFFAGHAALVFASFFFLISLVGFLFVLFFCVASLSF